MVVIIATKIYKEVNFMIYENSYRYKNGDSLIFRMIL